MKSLAQLPVLAIDCQATRSDPASGHLVEIGWVKTRAASPFDHERATETAASFLVEMEKDVRPPKQFLAMTGIESEEFTGAVTKNLLWKRLRREALDISATNQGICPAVIHFKRYEEPYIRHLHQEYAPLEEFPFLVLCTHEIVSRLYPGLPRKSLRAVAGFFGYSVPHFRRSLHHVVATAFIWNRVVRVLEEREKVVTLSDLRDWFSHPPPPVHGKHTAREYPMEKALRQSLPDKPGIYRMYRSTGDLLYIGKAKSLRSRVNSYFHAKGRHAEHILEMLSQARSLSTKVTETALEAAVLESDEIKLESPPYNRALQPNERHILFYAHSFKSKRNEPDIHHPLGPFPSSAGLEPLAKLLDVLNGKSKNLTRRLIGTVLHISPEYAPDKPCFKQGLESFTSEYVMGTRLPVHLGHILMWGTLFWKEKLVEKEQALQKESEQGEDMTLVDEDQEENEPGWTPDRVFRALKRQVRLGSFQMRRARWFCRLSESTITWANASDQGNKKHVLVIENGIPLFGKGERQLRGSFFPAGHKKTLYERQKNFDIAAYDRMRIVTTEIRRIIQEGRDIALCLHPGIFLGNTQLNKILQWV